MGWIRKITSDLRQNWPARLIEAAIGGATGLLVVATYIIARSAFLGVGSGDWLNFAGIVIAIVGSIGTTLAIHWIQERLADRRACRALLFAIEEFIEYLEFSETDSRGAAMAQWMQFEFCREQIDTAHAAMNRKNYQISYRIRGLDIVWAEFFAPAWKQLDFANAEATDIKQALFKKGEMVRHTLRKLRHAVDPNTAPAGNWDDVWQEVSSSEQS